jgi:hypothetical protein
MKGTSLGPSDLESPQESTPGDTYIIYFKLVLKRGRITQCHLKNRGGQMSNPHHFIFSHPIRNCTMMGSTDIQSTQKTVPGDTLICPKW